MIGSFGGTMILDIYRSVPDNEKPLFKQALGRCFTSEAAQRNAAMNPEELLHQLFPGITFSEKLIEALRNLGANARELIGEFRARHPDVGIWSII